MLVILAVKLIIVNGFSTGADYIDVFNVMSRFESKEIVLRKC